MFEIAFGMLFGFIMIVGLIVFVGYLLPYLLGRAVDAGSKAYLDRNVCRYCNQSIHLQVHKPCWDYYYSQQDTKNIGHTI